MKNAVTIQEFIKAAFAEAKANGVALETECQQRAFFEEKKMLWARTLVATI